ncbi:hypothetical protein BDM02DRAFT_1948477 [Thelephora ganbajun]|uniref:Uncharacterized protein n=1 Tax=Thelephora ganbajun TaxID=370292 RepID=A0ACB6ZHY7_THEGA|nr:hypothetical protein BDM02DRAFT_1948477 [Thelephora ganbajun]
MLSSTAKKLNSFKGYLASKDPRPLSPPTSPSVSFQPGGGDPSSPGADPGYATRQSWTQWAGEKLWRNGQAQSNNANVVEKLSLFPGWAARRIHTPSPGEVDIHFDVEIYVAGFASKLNNPESMSRSQKTFLRLAKGFASLPKLRDEAKPDQIPPPSSEMTDVKEMQSLEEHFRKLNNNLDTPPSSYSSTSSTLLGRSSSNSSRSSSSSDSQPIERTALAANAVRELHANLEQRLMPFWSSALSGRTIRVSLYISEEAASIAQALGKEAHDFNDPRLQPVASRKVTTAQDGSFQVKFGVPWDILCQHPDGVCVAFGDMTIEHDFFVLAELLPPPSPSSSSAVPQLTQVHDTLVSGAQIKIPLSHTPIRVLSDIDDTVKIANILAGARVIFYTVFVRNLVEMVIPGMGDWYTEMWRRGVRFHYVSNGPFEVLPMLNEFFPLAKLPPGSIKLRSYAGRSLFSGLLSAPAVRKRQGVIDVLSSFPESQFILVGDSGEQDIELYTAVATERPQQILAIFIRDARSTSNGGKPQPVEDPIGATAHTRWRGYTQRSDSSGSLRSFRQISRGASSEVTSAQPMMTPSPTPAYQNRQRSRSYSKRQNSTDYFSQSDRSSPASINTNDDDTVPWLSNTQNQEEPMTGEIDASAGLGPKPAKVPSAEWKRLELQMRVDRARMNMPQSVKFRLFVDPEECVEAFEVLDWLAKQDIKPDPNATARVN